MTTKHDITPEELIQLPVGYDGTKPINYGPIPFSEAVTGLNTFEHRPPMVVTDEDGFCSKDVELVCAEVFLRSLDKAGYVIIKKPAADGVALKE